MLPRIIIISTTLLLLATAASINETGIAEDGTTEHETTTTEGSYSTTMTQAINAIVAEIESAATIEEESAATTIIFDAATTQEENAATIEEETAATTKILNAATTLEENRATTEVENAPPTEANNVATTKVNNVTPTEADSEATTEAVSEATTETPKKCNNDSEFQCADGNCVPIKQKCDGAFNCEDGSDETTANCKDVERHMLGLLMHCMEDKLNTKPGVCPDVCRTEMDYCAYALLAAQSSKPEGVCPLPDFPKNGEFKVLKLDTNSASNFSDFALNFTCIEKTELVGEANTECVNGKWNYDAPFCSDTCKLNKLDKYTYRCKRDGRKTDVCGEYVAIGTEVIVELNDTKISNSTITTSARCTESLKLDANCHCVDAVDKRQQELEKDVMSKLTDFEDKFKKATHPSFAFEELVSKYRTCEYHANGNTTELKIQIAQCDMNLDLRQSNAEESSEKKE